MSIGKRKYMARLEKEPKFKFKSLGGELPAKQTINSAGWDVCANESVSISAGECYVLGLGIAIESGYDGFYLELHPRSGFRFRSGCEGCGIIDSDYRDEIKMILYPKNDIIIEKGDRIGQLIPKVVYDVMDCEVIDKDRSGGFGSTGK